jgi:hypothetical protein
MALTAPTTTNTYSPFWQATGDNLPYNMSQAGGRAVGANHVAKLFRKFGMRDARQAMAVLIGAVSGPTIAAGYNYIANPTSTSTTVPGVTSVGEIGGLRTIATWTVINRGSSTADVTELKRWFSNSLLEQGITYPTRLGSGGGSMIKGGMSAFT